MLMESFHIFVRLQHGVGLSFPDTGGESQLPMGGPDLLAVTGTAFVAVFLLLGALAGMMTLLVRLFQPPRPGVAAAEVVAISAAVAVAFPGGCVTRIEEV